MTRKRSGFKKEKKMGGKENLTVQGDHELALRKKVVKKKHPQ